MVAFPPLHILGNTVILQSYLPKVRENREILEPSRQNWDSVEKMDKEGKELFFLSVLAF